MRASQRRLPSSKLRRFLIFAVGFTAALAVCKLSICRGALGFAASAGQQVSSGTMLHTRTRTMLRNIAAHVTSDSHPASRLSLPWHQRLKEDMKAVVSFPYRAYNLGKIAKEVTEEIREQRASQATSASSSSSSSGASKTMKSFLPAYVKNHLNARTKPDEFRRLLNASVNVFLDSILAEEPFQFEPFHQAIRGPHFDHYAWGNDFFRAMVKFRQSRTEGVQHVMDIKERLAGGDNVVLIANHQTEADPQVLSLLLELDGYGDVAEKTIFVAGHKVTTDRLAIPMSMGRNLLTIFSKKYLNTFSEEEREAKSARNQATVSEMQRLLKEGGNIFWVAPSGGRDRRSPESGRFEPAKFDPQSVGLFLLLGQKAEKKGGPKTHFFPLAMWSNQLMPPPEGTSSKVGEGRSAARAPIGIEFGPKADPEALGGRKKFAAAIEGMVRDQYFHLDGLMTR